VSDIDFGFIKKLEGNKTKGYVPKDKDGVLGDSGVTIASGFDLGQRNAMDLKGLPEDIVKKFLPYLGLKGEAADTIASTLKISNKESDIINKFAAEKTVNLLKKRYENVSGKSFEDLTPEQQTVMASVQFQYGNLGTETPNFWRQVTTGDWDSAKKNLLDFGDDYPTRRKKEAALLK